MNKETKSDEIVSKEELKKFIFEAVHEAFKLERNKTRADNLNNLHKRNLITASEVAEMLNEKKYYVDYLRRMGKIPCVKYKNHYYFDKDKIKEAIENIKYDMRNL